MITVSVLAFAVLVTAAIATSVVVRDSTSDAAGGPSRSPAVSEPGDPVPSETPSNSPSPQQSEPAVVDPVFGDPVNEQVELGDTGAFADGVTARITGITFYDATGSGVGEVSGPAVRFAVDMTNGSSTPVVLDDVSVNAYSGEDTQPAFPYDSDSSLIPLSGSLPVGESASGIYSFGLPDGTDPKLTVTVSSRSGTPIVVFGP